MFLQIQLLEIDKTNWFDVTQLQISEENGRKFIVPIVYSLAESKYETHLCPLAIYNKKELIGFTMYGHDPDDGNYWIYVFMIDKRAQGQGFGRAALTHLVEHICNRHQVHKVVLGHKPENEKAMRLYESVGFADTGQRINGEIIRQLVRSR
ncbi:diamine N-acetyltransferase [Paenibacillus sp. J2TS4]|nr:diamine N-acetyltransferase [Paenibacillus sp. J2TS4]